MMNRIFRSLTGILLALTMITSVNAISLEEVRVSAEQGDASAQFVLGQMYIFGERVPKDLRTAAKWNRKAAEQGFAPAQYSLGLMYASGEGVPEDNREAARWYRKAAEQGDVGAQNNLGLMYYEGKGVPEDYVLAYFWFNLSAASGDSRAATNKEILREIMTPSQIEEAQRLSREWYLDH